jgi:hypothetical protein
MSKANPGITWIRKRRPGHRGLPSIAMSERALAKKMDVWQDGRNNAFNARTGRVR